MMDRSNAVPVLAWSAGLVLLASAPATVLAQAQAGSGYWMEPAANLPWRNAEGQCWRASYWTPAMATEQCDPDLVKKPEAAAPPPPPPPPPARPAPMMEKVTLSADTLFDFDKAVIRNDAEAKLDALVGKLKSVDLETVIDVGYTDRIGSEAYNLKLSQRRADAVKAYLVSRGIAADRIEAEGKGKANPVTHPGQCKGRKATRKLIACLQPDRRVEIEVIGTRAR